MPNAADQPSSPLRTWRPMAAWTAGILVVLGLTWFVAAVVVPVWQVRGEVARAHSSLTTIAEPTYAWPTDSKTRKQYVRRLSLYLRVPDLFAPNKARATRMLGQFGYDAMPELLKALRHRDAEVRQYAVMYLGSIGPKANQARTELARVLLNDPEASVREDAIIAIAMTQGEVIGPLTDHEKPWIRLHPEAAELLPVWSKSMCDSSAQVRSDAARLLGFLGPAAKEAVPALEKALRDDKESVRSAAAEALKKIRGEEPPK
jgi:HEAT repeat protein